MNIQNFLEIFDTNQKKVAEQKFQKTIAKEAPLKKPSLISASQPLYLKKKNTIDMGKINSEISNTYQNKGFQEIILMD